MFVLCFLGLVASCLGSGWETHKPVNGSAVEPAELPYMVEVDVKMGTWTAHGFAGVLLNENWILTTASNVHKHRHQPDHLTVIAGTVDSNVPLWSHGVEKIVIHENYNEQSSEHDIALMKVQAPFTMTLPHMKSVTLPRHGSTPSMGAEGIVAGWARSWENGPVLARLTKSRTKMETHSKCVRLWQGAEKPVHHDQICTKGHPVGNGPCNQTPGDALFIGSELVGLMVSGYPCGHDDYPTVYTQVSAYVNWIHEHMH